MAKRVSDKASSENLVFCAFEVQENVAKAISSAIILFIIVMFLTKLRKQFERGRLNKNF